MTASHAGLAGVLRVPCVGRLEEHAAAARIAVVDELGGNTFAVHPLQSGAQIVQAIEAAHGVSAFEVVRLMNTLVTAL